MREDVWEGGSAYESFMGRWSRRLAPKFVRWLRVDPDARWLEVGSGTGALTAGILDEADPESIVACDPSATYLEAARRRIADPRVRFMVADAGGPLPSHPGGYDAVVSSLALNFFPDPDRSVAAQVDRVRPGGVVAACVWDYQAGMQFLRYFWDVAVRIFPGAGDLDEGGRFPICDPEALREVWGSSGLEGVRVEPLTIETTFSGFDDFWNPFLGGPGPAPGFVSGLSDLERRSLESELRDSLPALPDGSIALQARAWAVAGTRREG